MSNKSGSSQFSSWRITSRTGALSDAITLQLHANALRRAELLAEAKKAQLDVDPTSGEDLQVLIQDLMNQTGTVIERVKNLLR